MEMETPFWTPNCKIKIKVFPYNPPVQFIYMEVEFGQTIWDKTKVLLGTSWGIYLGT
jgi:hypothetical protein